MSKLPDLSRTAAALERYDALSPGIFRKMEDVRSNAEATRLHDEYNMLAREVGVAYGLDTADRNNPKTCADVIRPGPAVPSPGSELSFVRRMVALWRKGE